MNWKIFAVVGVTGLATACDQQVVEARLREEAGRSGKVGVMVALSVQQSAIGITQIPKCPIEPAHVRMLGRLLEGQREMRRWEEERKLEIDDKGTRLQIEATLWNELGLETSQFTVFSLQEGLYRWTAPLSGESFERVEAPGDRDRMMAYGHGFQSILEDQPTCLDPIYDLKWKARMGVLGKPTRVQADVNRVEATWQIDGRVLTLEIEDLLDDRPR